MCMDMCMEMRIGMCTDMCMDMCIGYVYVHVYGDVKRGCMPRQRRPVIQTHNIRPRRLPCVYVRRMRPRLTGPGYGTLVMAILVMAYELWHISYGPRLTGPVNTRLDWHTRE